MSQSEAAGNLDQGLTSILNDFHSIYDAANDDPRISFAWNREPTTATLLAIRNARHHNHAHRIRSLEGYFTRAGRAHPSREYHLVTHGDGDGEMPLFVQALSWSDISDLLDMPFEMTRLSAAKVGTMRAYLGADSIASHIVAQTSTAPVFFDVLPLIVNAAKAAIAVIEPYLEIYSMEGEGFKEHFEDVGVVDTSVLNFRVCMFRP